MFLRDALAAKAAAEKAALAKGKSGRMKAKAKSSKQRCVHAAAPTHLPLASLASRLSLSDLPLRSIQTALR